MHVSVHPSLLARSLEFVFAAANQHKSCWKLCLSEHHVAPAAAVAACLPACLAALLPCSSQALLGQVSPTPATRSSLGMIQLADAGAACSCSGL